jgi:hypothetical protein
MAYDLYGQMFEVCSCKVLCPCWIGEDPDGGVCEGVMAWKVDRGDVNGLDVSGLTVAVLAHLPGNPLHGNWKVVIVVDDNATAEQQEALMQVFTGQLAGPCADLAGLFGEVVSIERAPVEVRVEAGQGTVRLGEFAYGELEPYQGATGKTTALIDTTFSTIPGSPAYISKAHTYSRNTSQFGIADVDLQGHNAVHAAFRFQT